jgi:hypothetical protein
MLVMVMQEIHDLRIRQALRLAQVSSVFLGIAMLLWGLAPAVVQRLVSGKAPPAAAFTVGDISLGLGVCFLLFSALMSRRVNWALWATMFLAAALVLGAIFAAVVHGTGVPALAPLLLAGATGATSWYALDVIRHESQHGRKRTPQP